MIIYIIPFQFFFIVCKGGGGCVGILGDYVGRTPQKCHWVRIGSSKSSASFKEPILVQLQI